MIALKVTNCRSERQALEIPGWYTDQTAKFYEMAVAEYAKGMPHTATGTDLDKLVGLTGTPRDFKLEPNGDLTFRMDLPGYIHKVQITGKVSV